MTMRDMYVGREHIVGGEDYDELLDHAMGAEPAPPARQAPPPPPPAPPHAYPYPPPYAYPPYPPPQQVQRRAPMQGNYSREEIHGRERRPRLERDEPRHERQFPVGFKRLAIQPGQEADIEVKPQVHFRGERFAVAPSIARYFDIVDIKVGKDSQLAAAGEMAAEAFSALAVGVWLELDTAQPGIVIILRVRNKDTVQHDFEAVLYGTVLK